MKFDWNSKLFRFGRVSFVDCANKIFSADTDDIFFFEISFIDFILVNRFLSDMLRAGWIKVVFFSSIAILI